MGTPQALKQRCPACDSVALFNSRSRGIVEELYFVFGAELYRCGSCETRFALVGRRTVPLRHLDGAGKKIRNTAWWVVTGVIIGGMIACLLIALAVLNYFHRWPF